MGMDKRKFIISLTIFLVLSFILGYLIYSIPFVFRFFNHELTTFLFPVFIGLVFFITSILPAIFKKYNQNYHFTKFILLLLFFLIIGGLISDGLLSLKAKKADDCETLFITNNYDWSEFGTCYINKAMNKSDESYCWAINKKLLWKAIPHYFSSTLLGEQMQPTHYRDMCLTKIAKLNNNSKFCKYVTEKENCLIEINRQ